MSKNKEKQEFIMKIKLIKAILGMCSALGYKLNIRIEPKNLVRWDGKE